MGAITLNLKLKAQAFAPMTANGYMQDIKNVAAIVFQNVGDSTVRIFNGLYTILPNGGTLSLNATESPNEGLSTMDILQLMVTFTGGTTNRLEVLVLRPSNDDTPLIC